MGIAVVSCNKWVGLSSNCLECNPTRLHGFSMFHAHIGVYWFLAGNLRLHVGEANNLTIQRSSWPSMHQVQLFIYQLFAFQAVQAWNQHGAYLPYASMLHAWFDSVDGACMKVYACELHGCSSFLSRETISGKGGKSGWHVVHLQGSQFLFLRLGHRRPGF